MHTFPCRIIKALCSGSCCSSSRLQKFISHWLSMPTSSGVAVGKSCNIQSSLFCEAKCDCPKQEQRILPPCFAKQNATALSRSRGFYLLVLRSKMLCRFTCISSYIKHYTWKNINLLGNSVKIVYI